MSTRTTSAIVGTGLLLLGMVAGGSPVPAAVTAKKAPGKAVVDVAPGCSAKLQRAGKTTKVPDSGVVRGLAPGTYKVVVKPAKCKPKKAKITVKKGGTTKTKVLYDPQFVPTSYSGTISGSERASDGQSVTARWSANVLLALEPGISLSSFANFETLARYRVTEFSGSWSIDYTDGAGCANKGGGQLAMSDLLNDASGRPDAWWLNPWNNYTYAFQARANVSKKWLYARTCMDGTSQEEREPPHLLVSTNAWFGSDQIPPLKAGYSPSGSFARASTTWNWDFEVELSKELSRPTG